MNITPANNQAFTGRYLYVFDDIKASRNFEKEVNNSSVIVDDHVLLRDPYYNQNLLLLTGQDYQDYKLMTSFVKGKNPVMNKDVYDEQVYRALEEKANIVDLQRYVFRDCK